ncbi:MAG: DUF2062 domain-containing protein [Nitrospirota bacterium]|nr:DUF2062 domain-containing protein [Nitrospirota bacterium]
MSLATLRERLRALLTQGGDPHHMALAFGVGVAIAFSPFIGVHTLMAVLAVWIFRLNPMAVFVGAFINNPWTMVPLYAGCLWVGVILWSPEADLPPLSFSGLSMGDFLSQFQPYLIPFVIGTSVLALAGGVAGYYGLRALILSYRARRPVAPTVGQRQRAADIPEPPGPPGTS